MMQLFLDNVFSAGFLFTVIRVGTPILFAALAAMISTKCGVVNITIDGTMLMSALIGTLVSAFTQSLLLGGLAGAQIGLLAQTDRDQAEALFEVMLSVYNYGSPVNQAVQAGMANPYSSDSIAALAASFA